MKLIEVKFGDIVEISGQETMKAPLVRFYGEQGSTYVLSLTGWQSFRVSPGIEVKVLGRLRTGSVETCPRPAQ